MHRVPIIVDVSPIVRSEVEHAVQRCDADLLYVRAEEYVSVNRNPRVLANRNVEAEGPCGTRAVKKCVNRERVERLGWALHPELSERRDLLRPAETCIERKPSRRGTVIGTACHRPEITRTEES